MSLLVCVDVRLATKLRRDGFRKLAHLELSKKWRYPQFTQILRKKIKKNGCEFTNLKTLAWRALYDISRGNTCHVYYTQECVILWPVSLFKFSLRLRPGAFLSSSPAWPCTKCNWTNRVPGANFSAPQNENVTSARSFRIICIQSSKSCVLLQFGHCNEVRPPLPHGFRVFVESTYRHPQLKISTLSFSLWPTRSLSVW